MRRRQLFRFATVGAATFVLTTALNYALKLTVLTDKPVTALAIATVVATAVSYVLSREWSFDTRGGRTKPAEAALFFLVNALAVGLNLVPPLVSRYALDLRAPEVPLVTQEAADFVSGMVVGTLLGAVFRWWAYRKWVFPAAGAHSSSSSSRLSTFPVGVRGSSSTNTTSRGIANRATRRRRYARTMSSSSRAPGRTVTNATSRCPNSSSGTPTTAASATPGSSVSASSTGRGNTFSPPETIMSSSRPATNNRPSASR